MENKIIDYIALKDGAFAMLIEKEGRLEKWITYEIRLHKDLENPIGGTVVEVIGDFCFSGCEFNGVAKQMKVD